MPVRSRLGTEANEETTYHFTNTVQGGRITRDQRTTVINVIRRRNRHSVRNNDASLIPSRRHGAAEGVEESLGFSSHALSATGLVLVGLRNSGGLAGLQGAGIQRVDSGESIGEGGAVGGVEGRCEGEELEGLNAGDWDDVVVV